MAGIAIMSFQGRKNIYVCDDCEAQLITIDRDEGTTPFMTACPVCNGMTVSKCYRVPQDIVPTHEWYRPDTNEYRTIKNPGTLDHIDRGGLILRVRL